MDPHLLGQKYDKIAGWWHDQHKNSAYGLGQVERAIQYAPEGKALDVGCGAGGRMTRRLLAAGFDVRGIDISQEMLRIARREHPEVSFDHATITDWITTERFALILAWDSIFHLPLNSQKSVLAKLCDYLIPGGVFAYTFGDALGDHHSDWHNDSFYYSSIGIAGNLEATGRAGCGCRHLELDQFPENHVFIIVRKDE